PVPGNPERRLLGEAARQLGWEAGPVPLAINSIPYNHRPACVRCGTCVGFACPTDSKNGTQNTMIPRALATGRCTLVTEAMAERIDTDFRGRVCGVTFFITE